LADLIYRRPIRPSNPNIKRFFILFKKLKHCGANVILPTAALITTTFLFLLYTTHYKASIVVANAAVVGLVPGHPEAHS
jgi:hypothetical protein